MGHGSVLSLGSWPLPPTANQALSHNPKPQSRGDGHSLLEASPAAGEKEPGSNANSVLQRRFSERGSLIKNSLGKLPFQDM